MSQELLLAIAVAIGTLVVAPLLRVVLSLVYDMLGYVDVDAYETGALDAIESLDRHPAILEFGNSIMGQLTNTALEWVIKHYPDEADVIVALTNFGLSEKAARNIAVYSSPIVLQAVLQMVKLTNGEIDEDNEPVIFTPDFEIPVIDSLTLS